MTKTGNLKRLIHPSLNPTGIGSAIAAVYAGVVMIWNATHHHAVIEPQVIVSAFAAAAFLYTRFKVTPIADPRDGNGNPISSGILTEHAAPAPLIPPTAP